MLWLITQASHYNTSQPTKKCTCKNRYKYGKILKYLQWYAVNSLSDNENELGSSWIHCQGVQNGKIMMNGLGKEGGGGGGCDSVLLVQV